MSKDYGLSFISNEDLLFHVERAINSKPNREIALSMLKCNSAFHQSLLKSITHNKRSSSKGFDMIDKGKKIFAEIKSMCSNVNSFSARDTYMEMQHTILSDRSSLCYLVEMQAEPSQDMLWKITLDGQKLSHNNIRCISINKFYQRITGINSAFTDICQILPQVFDDVITLRA